MPNSKTASVKKKVKKKTPDKEVTIPSSLFDELIEISKGNNNKIEREDFTQFLEENNLMKQKKEITQRLGSMDIKISR